MNSINNGTNTGTATASYFTDFEGEIVGHTQTPDYVYVVNE